MASQSPSAARAEPNRWGGAGRVRAHRYEAETGCRGVGGDRDLGRSDTGYRVGNPEANAKCFFRRRGRRASHGDLGPVDAEGLPDADGRLEGDHQPRRREVSAARGGREYFSAAIRRWRRSVTSAPGPHSDSSGRKVGRSPGAQGRAPRTEAETPGLRRTEAPGRLQRCPRRRGVLDEIPKGGHGTLLRHRAGEKLRWSRTREVRDRRLRAAPARGWSAPPLYFFFRRGFRPHHSFGKMKGKAGPAGSGGP